MKNKVILVLFFSGLINNAQNKVMEFEYQYDQGKVNKSGDLDGELTYTYGKNLAYKHIYKEGKLLEATNYCITIDGQKPLIGKYKNGNPFEGYFIYANEFEIPLIDYYENGTFIAQYTCPLLDLIKYEDQLDRVEWNKTIYKNNKPVSGLYHKEFNLGDSHLLASEYYEDGLITNIDLWIMAIHYAELIKIKFESDGYTIYKEEVPGDGDPEIDRRARSISVQFKDSKNGSVIFKVINKIIAKYQFSYADLSQEMKKTAGNVSYVFHEDTIFYVQRHAFEINQDLYKEDSSYNQNIISQVYMSMKNKPISHFTTKGDNDYSEILQMNERFNVNAILYLGENGKPFRGFFIEKEGQTDKYKYAQYLDSKVVANGTMLTIKEIENLVIGKG